MSKSTTFWCPSCRYHLEVNREITNKSDYPTHCGKPMSLQHWRNPLPPPNFLRTTIRKRTCLDGYNSTYVLEDVDWDGLSMFDADTPVVVITAAEYDRLRKPIIDAYELATRGLAKACGMNINEGDDRALVLSNPKFKYHERGWDDAYACLARHAMQYFIPLPAEVEALVKEAQRG